MSVVGGLVLLGNVRGRLSEIMRGIRLLCVGVTLYRRLEISVSEATSERQRLQKSLYSATPVPVLCQDMRLDDNSVHYVV